MTIAQKLHKIIENPTSAYYMFITNKSLNNDFKKCLKQTEQYTTKDQNENTKNALLYLLENNKI